MRSAVRVVSWLLGIVALSGMAAGVTASRILQPVNSERISALRGNVHPMARPEFDQGALDPSQMLHRVTIFFNRSAAQQQELDKLLEEQQDPKSLNFHKWLTPEQFGEHFGLADADLSKVRDWLTSQGFSVDEVARDRTWISFSGSVGQISSAFRTELHQYAMNGEVHFANATPPAIPSALADVVAGIRALNNFKPNPRSASRRVKPDFTSSLSGNHYVAPSDFAAIYNVNDLYAAGFDGSGQKIAVMGQTDIITSDIATFRSVSGLPTNAPQVILVPGSSDPGIVSSDIQEASLDVEWAGAVAPKATVIYVNSNNGVFDSMSYAISNNVAPVISISYGDCEPNFSSNDLLTLASQTQQANAQGQTVVGPSGDDGAADCDYSSDPNVVITSAVHGLAVDVPASLPYVTGVGGSAFNEGTGSYWNTSNNNLQGSAFLYIPEVTWNDTSTSNGLSASGGGVSTVFTKPTWQVGTGVPNDGFRDVPDISLNASPGHDGFITCSQGDCQICVTGDANCTASGSSPGYRRSSDQTLDITGGTSAGVPTFAGLVALINQKMGAPQGNVNSRLYALAASTPYVLHDLASGDNKVPCTTGTKDCPNGGTIGYSAGIGYDQATGLGSVHAYNLVTNWDTLATPTADFGVSFFNSTLSVARGGNATIPVMVRGLNGFSSAVNLSCTSALSGVSCSVNPGSVTPDGSTTVTITASSSAALHAPGSKSPFSPWWTSAFGAAALFGMGKKGSRKQMVGFALLALALLIGFASCGGGSSSSSGGSGGSGNGGSGNVTLSATSGSLSHTAQLTVTVK
ncbi:MAG: S53 family peptidase [Terriglobales bacterium]